MFKTSHKIIFSINNIQHYWALCKPKVVLMLLITATVGMQLSSTHFIDIKLLLIANLGIGLAASSAAVINHLVDVNIDALMIRTQARPIVSGKVSNNNAMIFAFLLATTSMILLTFYVNTLTAVLTLFGIVGYAGVYTMYLKHRTSQNIVIGGLSGALPPLLGWTSVTNQVDLGGLVLLLIIFIWTPAHFWPLAIDRIEDYKKAKVPMLPVTHGIAYTKNCIIIYTLVLLPVSLLPYFINMSGNIYLVSAILLGIWFLYSVLQLKYKPVSGSAMQSFYVSIYYLLGLFSAMLVDHYHSLYLTIR